MLRLKRIMSFLLALTMLAQMLPVHTFAQEAEEETVPETVVIETALPEAETSLPEETAEEPSFAEESTAAETEAPVTEAVTVPETEVPVTEEVTIPETEVPVTEEETVPETESSEPETAPTEETLPSISQEAAGASSGTWGADITWSVSDSGVLTISGTGEMSETNSSDYIPWDSYRSSITKVVIGSGVTTVCDYAFVDCTSLTSVTIPSGVTVIGNYAFYGCTALSTVAIPSTVRTIGTSVFTECTGLTAMTIPDSVTSIDGYLFMGCTNLSTVKLSNNITSIGGYMFEDCSSLTSVTIPEMVTYIGSFAFSGCSSLSSITIPESVTRINDSAFAGCSKLTRVTIPKNVSFIGENPFRDCTNLAKIQVNSANTSFVHDASGVLYDYNKTTLIAAPCTLSGAYIIGESVTTVNGYAFSGCRYLTAVTFGISVDTIIYHIFHNCTNLEEIHFLGNVPTDFRTSAFSGVTATATYPAGNSTWGTSAQQGYGGTITWEPANISVGGSCGDSLTWNLKDNVLTISGTGKMYEYDQAPWYGYRASVTDVILENGVTSIEGSSFSGFSALVRLSLPDTVTTIGTYAFSSCNALTSVTLPSNLTAIPDSMFSYCTSLTDITIPESVTKIGSYAFRGCTGLTGVTIPKSVTSIGTNAFRDCTGLQRFSVDTANTAYCTDRSGVLYSKDMSTLIQAPTSLSGTYVIPHSTGIIESYAFSDCTGLTGVTITSANIINNYAFQNCTGLLAVYIPDSVLTIASTSGYGGKYYSPFYGCTYDLILYCGAASKPSSWSTYWNYRGTSSLRVNWGVSAEEGAFLAGKALKEDVVVPDCFTSIPNNAFYNHKNLKSITIPDTVTSIGDYAFYGCSALTEITLPKALTTIGTYAFYNCAGLAEISLPAGVAAIGSYAFGSSPLPDGIWADPDNTTFASDSFGVLYDKAMTIVLKAPASLTGTYVIPEGVTGIDDSAFDSCAGLTGIVIPEGVISIGTRAFDECTGLTNVSIPGTVTSIGVYAFYGCTNMTALTLQEGLTTISNSAFYNCTGLTTVRFPASVTSLGTYAFSGCSALSEIRFFGDAPSIGMSAFQGVTAKAYHLADNTTWTTSKKTNYGGTLTWKGVCGSGHTVVTDEAVEPTCTSDGFTEGSHCSECLLVFVAQEVLPGGHVPMTDEAVPPSCTSDGFTEGSHCDVCGEILTPQEIIPAAHTVVTDEAVDATCTKPGLTEGSHCSACGEVFTAQQEIAATGHEFSGDTCTLCGAATGSCGTGLTWILEDGILTISGSGAMGSYSMGGAPWYAKRSTITAVVIGPEVTSIGTYAFAYCSNLKTVTFHGDQPTIGTNAFYKVTAEVLYNGSWSSDSLQNYGGTLTWTDPCGGNHTVVTDNAVAATCTASGLTEGKHCSVCGMVLQAQTVVDALGHNWSGWKTVTAATCTENGQQSRSCSRCSHTETQSIDATGHNYESTVTVPGCESQGYTSHLCLNCGDSYVNGYTAALGHDMSVRTTIKAATCTENGQEKQQCSRCSHSELVVLEATGHSYQSVVTDPGCETTGYTTHTCSGCGDSYKNTYTAALGHNLGRWETVNAATCTSNGSQRRDCSRCDHYEMQVLAATGHNEQTLAAVAATCTASGLTEGKGCISCGLVTKAQATVSALGHAMSSWTISSAATCTKEGVRRRDCSRCDHYETQSIDATGHSRRALAAVEATCTTSGLTEGADCSTCGAILTAQKTVAALGHNFGSWTTTKAATCTTSGQQRRDCGRCSHYETRILQSTGHKEKVVPAVAATCTTSGLTEGKQCSVCQQILLAQETVEAIGHKYVNFICQNCGGYASGSGNLGQNVTWEVDTQTGTLTISGSGPMTVPSEVPWAGFEDAITEIVISDGITRIDSGIFEGLDNLTDITVHDGNPVYKDVDGILFSRDGSELIRYPAGREDAEYTVPETVARIEDNAFSGCDAPQTLIFPGSMPEFGEDAFTDFNGTVCYPGEDPSWDPELLPDNGITWVPQYDQPEVLSITADHQVLRLGEQAVLTAQLNMEQSGQILWEVTDGSSCVHFSAGGTMAILTAKAVAVRTTVTVTARTAGGVAPAAKISIDILPQVQSLSIRDSEGSDVTEKVIWWDLNSGITEKTFTAAVHPADAPADVTWAFSDVSRSYAQYTTDGNALTISNPTGEIGMVTITATAADGSGQNARFVIRFTALRTETDTPEGEDPADLRLLSGKTRTLTVYDEETGKPLTAKQITWFMDEVYAPYAKIDTKGKLTAKKVVEKVRIEVIGTIIGSEGTTVTITVDIYPAATSLELLREDTLVNNQTISVDSGAKPLVLTANIHPLDAMEGVDWVISDKKEAFASYEIEDNILTVTPKAGAKASAVTVKAMSTDGSKKSATVKLQFGTYARTVTIDKNVTQLTVGDKAIQLSASMEPAVVTKPGILWSLKNPADKNYVNLAAGGKIAPKAVLAPVDVVIVATSKDGMASDEHTVTIYPKSDAQLVIKSGDTYVTKTAQTLDVNIRESITLSAHTYGQEGLTKVEWSPLTAKGADITVNTDGTLTVRMTSPANLNITAKAEDGRKATVSLKGMKLASSVEIAQKKTGITEGLEIASGKSLDLEARLTNAANKKVTWSLEECGAYATLSSGKLTAAKDLTSAHKVVVRATAEGGVYDEMEVMVRPAARGVQIYSEAGGHMLFSFRSRNWWVRSNTTLVWDCETQGDTISLNARVYPYYSEDSSKNAAQAVTWVSSAPKVAQLVTGPDGSVQLICHTTGRTTITATAADGSKEKVSFQLLVVKSIASLGLTDQNLACGKKLDLSKLISIAPLDATSKKLSFEILEGAQFITLNKNGVLSAKKDAAGGKVRIRITPAEYIREDVFAEITVSIFAAATRVAIFDGDYDATGQQGSISIKNGEDTTLLPLHAVVYPFTDDGNNLNDAGQNVIWTSSNTAYAEVEDGLVVLKRTGIGKTVTITVSTTDGSGKKASVKIRINAE